MINLVINPVFTTDLITNSSSELFVCNTDKTLAAVKEVLKALLDAYNLTIDEPIPFDECYGDIGYAKDLPHVVTSYLSYKSGWWHNPHKWGTPEFNDYRDEQERKARESLPDNFDNYIMIRSDSDNTIPYELFDLIENAFNAERWHLG